MGPERCSDGLSFFEREAGNFSEVRAATGQCCGDVDVEMWDRLVGGCSIVLPDGDPARVES